MSLMANSGDVIENHLTDEVVVFTQTTTDTDGRFLELENNWMRADHHTPAHIHPSMDERWEVLNGVAGFRIDGVESTLGAGESIVAPAGSLHEGWSLGMETVHLRIQITPALGWEHFVERLFTLSNEAYRQQLKHPPTAQLLALFAEFPREIAFAE